MAKSPEAITPAFPDLFEAVTRFRAGDRRGASRVLKRVITGPECKDAFLGLFGLYVGALEVMDVIGTDRAWSSEEFVQRTALEVAKRMLDE